MGKNVEKIDPNVVKTIKKSSKKFGQLYPILLDANEEIIDGEHRKKALEKPNILKLPNIKTKKDRLEARLIANHARKGQHKTTWTPTLNELAKLLAREGVEKIGMKIAEETGIPYRTLMRYLPNEFKDKAQAQRASHPRLSNGNHEKVKESQPSETKHLPEKTEKGIDTKEVSSQQLGNLDEYEALSEKPRPKIEIKEFRNQPWKAIIIPEEFYSKLEKACAKRDLNLQETVTLALMKLLEDLRRNRDG